jgi:Ca2+-binding RTX toxin-like protein
MIRSKVALACIVGSLAAAGPAGAATVVGSTLAGTPFTGQVTGVTITQKTQPPGTTQPLTAPTNGRVVSVKIKQGAVTSNETAGFSFLSGTSPNYTARTDPELPDFGWVTGEPAGIREFMPAGTTVPVFAGERLALRTLTGSVGTPNITAEAPGGARDFVFANHTSGPAVYTSTVGREQLMQFTMVAACASAVPGTNGPDTLIGDDRADSFAAKGGDDFVAGQGGDDCLNGEGGNDVILGGAGVDTIDGGGGGDLLRGEDGSDIIAGGAGGDQIEGGDGADSIDAGVGTDTVLGGAGNDIIDSDDGVKDTVDCGAGTADVATVDALDSVTNCEIVN